MSKPSVHINVSAVSIERDADSLLALDTSYTTYGFFEALTTSEPITLRTHALVAPMTKRFPFELHSLASTANWLAESEGQALGVIATRFDSWNRRLTICHFYVTANHRRQGIGERLLRTAVTDGARSGATFVWAETSNYNLPGIAAYQSLGFETCGFDKTLYANTPAEGEFAIFLAAKTEQVLGR